MNIPTAAPAPAPEPTPTADTKLTIAAAVGLNRLTRTQRFLAAGVAAVMALTTLGVGYRLVSVASTPSSPETEHPGSPIPPQQPQSQQQYTTVCTGGQPSVVSDWGRVVATTPVTCRQIPVG